VQRVTTRWTQESRGGAAATRRNACPVAFAFPERAVWHSVEMREWEDFEVRSSWGDVLDDLGRNELLLKETERGLSVRPVPSPWWVPARDRRPPSYVVQPGTWVRWVLNYRTGGADEWAYGLVTYSIANVEAVGDLFLGDPDHEVDERAWLR
jgi:hypothetical protein